jgi:YggT family protein
MMAEGLQFLVQTVGNLFVTAVLLRFFMQLFRVPFRNPFAQFIVAVTDFAIKPLRRIVPGLFGIDWASLVLAFGLEAVIVVAGYWLREFPFALAGMKVWPVFAGLALVRLADLVVYLLIGLVLVRAVLSWVNPFSPLAPVMYELTEPFLRPLRRVVPVIANVDLAPLVFILICQLVLIAPIQALERALLAGF